MRISKLFATVLAASTVSCVFFDEEPMPICTLAGCDSGAGFEVFEGPDGSALIEATLRVCRNASCGEARIVELPAVYEGRPLSLQGDLAGQVNVDRGPSGYAVTARVHGQGEYPYGFADGDVYTLELRARDSMLLSSQVWTATYVVAQPNGPDCEPTCVQAVLAPR